MSAESAVSGGLSPARQEFISCCSYYFLVIFKQATILVFWQDKHADILLNMFFIPSGSTFTVSPTTTAGMFISLFNFNSNFALKIVQYFYFRVVGIDSRGEDKDSTNCVICLTGNNLSLVTCHLWSVSQVTTCHRQKWKWITFSFFQYPIFV